MSSPVAFILGGGPNVGKALSRMLISQGYKVAVGSRSQKGNEHGDNEKVLKLNLDVTEAGSIDSAFRTVTKELGQAPSVVVYNPGGFTAVPVAGDPLSLPAEAFTRNMLMGTHVFNAAQHALKGFRTLGSSRKAFIVTGNITPFLAPSASFVSLQHQKTLAARLVELFHQSYAAENIHFYFASEVQPNGDWVRSVSGEGHALAYQRLLEAPELLPWDQRFHADGSSHQESTGALS